MAPVSELCEMFRLADADLVQKFLDQDGDVATLLPGLADEVCKHFGQVVCLLEVIPAVEVGQPPELAVLIPTSLPVPEAASRLEALEEQWLADQPDEIAKRLLFDFTYE